MENWRTWKSQQNLEAVYCTGRVVLLLTTVLSNASSIHWIIYRILLWAPQMINPVQSQMGQTKYQWSRPELKEALVASIPLASLSCNRYQPLKALTGWRLSSLRLCLWFVFVLEIHAAVLWSTVLCSSHERFWQTWKHNVIYWGNLCR